MEVKEDSFGGEGKCLEEEEYLVRFNFQEGRVQGETFQGNHVQGDSLE